MFSYVVMIFMLIMNIIGIGIHLAKLGEDRKGTYSTIELFLSVLFSVLLGLSLLWWPK